MDVKKKVLLAAMAVMVMLVVGGVAAYANSFGSSLQEPPAQIDQSYVEQVVLESIPGTIQETQLENDDFGNTVYDVEVAGDDGQFYDAKVDAATGQILDQGLEESVDEADQPGEDEGAEGPNEIEGYDDAPGEIEDND